MSEYKGKIAEIFGSIQGEGIYQGIRQIFIRFYGCNLSCRFCDTRLNFYRKYSINDLLKRIDSYNGNYHSISLTGGEPLLQVNFLKDFLSKLKKRRIYLETNGTLPEELAKIIDKIDIISMDIKLPSSTGLKDFWDEHKRFLEIALKRKLFIKAVICNSTRLQDIRKTVELIADFDKNIPFILQPNSFEVRRKKLMQKLANFQKFCSNYLYFVRVIPQMHKFLGIR